MDLTVAPKKIKEVQAWLEEAALPGTAKFLVLAGSPGVGKSTLVHCLARELHWDLVEWREAFSSSWQPNYAEASMEYESSLQNFESFLAQNAVGYPSLGLQQQSSRPSPGKSNRQGRSLILLQDLPYCHGMEAEARLRASLTKFVQESIAPTVLIFSDVAEGKHRPDDLERLVEAPVLYSQLTRITTVPAATKSRLKRCVEAVTSAEGLPRLSPSQYEDLHLQSGGDVRHALMTLQFEMAVTSSATAPGKSTGRDQRLTAFHALGKLLYAKREVRAGEASHQGDRPPLNFDPEQVVERTGMDVSRVLDFVQFNGMDFFTDVEELSRAWERLSDAAMWASHGSSRRSQGQEQISQTTFAASLAGRSVANFNRHPAAGKFRQLSAPPSSSRQAQANADLLTQHMERQATLGQVRWSVETSSWAQERVSYLQKITPHESIDLQSFWSMSSAKQAKDAQVELAERIRQEQDTMMQADDIEEFDDDEDDKKKAIAPSLQFATSVSPVSTTELSISHIG
jgi:cell cycle checkpoint protein